MASPRFEIMARSGPEDTLKAVPLGSNSSGFLTAGQDWSIVMDKPAAAGGHYKDVEEAQRLSSLVEGSTPEGRILRDLAASRYVCTQPSFALQVCQQSVRAHQVKQCTPVYVEQLKCQIKLARAVDTLCRQPFAALAACLKKEGEPHKCLSQVTAFDQCTENF